MIGSSGRPGGPETGKRHGKVARAATGPHSRQERYLNLCD
jgi:hypothetical protein